MPDIMSQLGPEKMQQFMARASQVRELCVMNVCECCERASVASVLASESMLTPTRSFDAKQQMGGMPRGGGGGAAAGGDDDAIPDLVETDFEKESQKKGGAGKEGSKVDEQD